MALGVADQALQRRYQLFRDQHNRQWGSSVEKSTGHPTGVWEPKFRAPIMPDPKYLEIDDTRPGRLRINYAQWIIDLDEESRRYIAKGRRYGFDKYGKLFDPNAPFSEEILQYVGPAPKAKEPVMAAQQGNRWALGLLGPNGETPLMPEALAPYFIVPEPKIPDFRDEYGDTVDDVDDEPPAPTVAKVIYETKPKKKMGRPTNAERAARAAEPVAEG